MKKINGKEIAAKKMLALKDEVAQMQKELALAVILIGDDEASHLYVKLKEKAAKQLGIELRKYIFAHNVSRDDIVQTIEFLNSDEDTDGIIVQLPLPEQLDVDDIVSQINPDKDVDGFHPVNQQKFLNDEGEIFPVFPSAIINLIESEVEDLNGKNAVVIGKSDVFDSMMTHALQQKGTSAQFISCTDKDRFSQKENDMINNADIIVTACGKPNILSCDAISDSTIVIDGGINKVGDKIVGDVELDEERKIIISPVPGGVGPVTIACLFENVVKMTKKQLSN